MLFLISLQTWIKFQYQLIHNRLKVKMNCTLVWCFNCSAWSNTVNLDEPCEVFEHYSLHRHPNLTVKHCGTGVYMPEGAVRGSTIQLDFITRLKSETTFLQILRLDLFIVCALYSCSVFLYLD